jgi:hypothetical protein
MLKDALRARYFENQYFYCMSVFRPTGRKTDIQGIEHDHQAKVLVFLCCRREESA